MFIEALEKEMNKSITENGALGYKTTKHEIVDFNFKVASYRNKTEEEIKADFKKVWGENKELALKYLFYVRDVREGLGERRLFRICIKEILNELDKRVFDWIVEMGRCDDLFVFIGTKLQRKLIDYITKQLAEDYRNMKEGKPISLLSKWMPSVNTSSKETKKLAKIIICEWKKISPQVNEKEYRHMLSELRSYLDVIEKKMCSQKYSEINYETVPSQANLKYKDAFLKHDETRRKEYLESLEKGEAKINSSVLFPHDIVHKYMLSNYSLKRKDTALEAMWKGLPDYVKGNCNTLVVRDGSPSMTCNVGGTSTSALQVATALSIYFSERAKGEFKDKFITFSSRPKFVDLHNLSSLHDKLEECYRYNDCSNTNIEKTFNLILDVAVKNNLKQEDIPNLLIISDMEFDNAESYYRNDTKLFNVISAKFKAQGYEMPKLIFWNVNSRTNTIPLTQNKNGVILVSGFSPAITKMVLSEQTDPYQALVEQLMSERYSKITLQK